MTDSSKCTKQPNKIEIEELFNREKPRDKFKDINRTSPRDESKEINRTTNKTVQIERLKFELLFNRTQKKEPKTILPTSNNIDKGNDKKRANDFHRDNIISNNIDKWNDNKRSNDFDCDIILNNINTVNDKERSNDFDRDIISNNIDEVNDKEKSNDFDRDSLERIPTLNIDKDSLGDNIETDSLDEIDTDSLNNNKGKDKRLNQNRIVDIEESTSFDKSDIDGDIFVNSSNIDKSESEIYADILKTIQNTVENSDTEDIFEDTLNTIEDIPNNNLHENEKPIFRRNSDDEFELSVNELSVKESRAALASEIQSSCYSYDKFDRFFSAIDFSEEPTSMQRVPDTTRSTKKSEGGGSVYSGYQKKKIPILSNTIARNERRKVSYLEQYKKKCSKKLKKVMKDTETKTVEYSSLSRAASDVCSVSSKNSFGSNGEIEGIGDHVRDDEQYYYDAITKYDSHSTVSYEHYQTFEDGSNILRSIPKSYNSTTNVSYEPYETIEDGRNGPRKSYNPNGTNIPTSLGNSSQGWIIPKNYNPNETNTSERNISTNIGNSTQDNYKLGRLHKKDSMSTTKSNSSMNDVKPVQHMKNKVARNIVNEEVSKNGFNIRKSERSDIEVIQNVNQMHKRARSVQNVIPTRSVHMIASQKSMPIYRSQHMTSSKTKLQNVPTNKHPTIEQNMGETDTNSENQSSSQNLMSTYPTSVQNIAKVYPLARVFPHRRRESCGGRTNQIHALREPSRKTTCQLIGNQNTMSIPSQQELARKRSNQIQKVTSTTSKASPTKNQPTKSTSSILIRNTVKPKEVTQQDLNRNTNPNKIKKVGATALNITSIAKQEPAKTNSSMPIRFEKLSTRSSVRENIQAFEQKRQQEEANLKQNIGKELIVKTLKTSQKCFSKSRQDVEISTSQVQESQTQLQKNAQEKSKVCLPPRQQSQKSFTKVSQQESVGKLEGKQESQQKLSMQRKSQVEVSKIQSKCQQNALKQVSSNQNGITRFQKISPQEIGKVQTSSLQKIAKSQKKSAEDVSKSATNGQHEIVSSPRSSEDTDSVSVHTQTLSDKGTQFEDIYQDSLHVETIYPKLDQKRPATTSDNRQRMPQPVRHLSSKPRKSYVELYQQKIVTSKKIPVPISKLNLKPRRVEEKMEMKKSIPGGGGGENKEQQRKGKVIPKMMNDSAKAGPEGNKLITPKQPLPRYNLKKRIPIKEELPKPDKVVVKSKSVKPTQNPVEEDQDDLQLKLLDEKREQLQKQLSTIKSKPRAYVLHYKK